uniref:Uncharacterized protein LOC8265361 n=1 Tax=Rhizophora mucronata TaxID=61149 RepID=A0A2P2MDD7_RHIMU
MLSVNTISIGLFLHSMHFYQTTSAAKLQTTHASGCTRWPLTGGIPCQQSDTENYQIERVYIAGYQDGSVRVWDATDPTLLLLHVFGPEMKGVNMPGASASVSALEFCSYTLSLAVGNELGLSIQAYGECE